MSTSDRPTPRRASHFSGQAQGASGASSAYDDAYGSAYGSAYGNAGQTPTTSYADQQAYLDFEEPMVDTGVMGRVTTISSRDVAQAASGTMGGAPTRVSAATRRAASYSARQRVGGHSSAARVAPLVIIALVAIVAIGGITYFFLSHTGTSTEETSSLVPDGTEVVITVAEGSGASTIAQQLYEGGLIESTSEFLTRVRRMEAESTLKSGTYTFTGGTSLDGIITKLVEGPGGTFDFTLTIPEGYSVAQTASVVEAVLGIPTSVFMEAAKASNYVDDYSFLADVGNDSLEGFLFPKTYGFNTGVTADTVIRTLLTQYEIETAEIDWDSAIAGLRERFAMTFTEYDIIRIASIIEREALTDDQRGLISSVFYNRLAIGMALQSDATLAYTDADGIVTQDDLAIDSDYNTYTRVGLPPTPICSPRIESIMAALSPERTDYYYFYITATAEVFSETYDQHLQAIANDS